MRAGPSNGFGNLIVIKHADGTETWYGHEEAVLVSVGQYVRAGQRIALVGSLGESTGPHLHFQVMVHGTAVDPVPWLAARGVHV
jgi:murein DD-endopeptidase MepM/ murein hydrolase activator NlpD